MRHGKTWGYTTDFFRNAMVSAYHLEVRKGGYCSEHKHDHKYNSFYVVSGELEITIWREGEKPDVTIIGPGQSTAVSPGFWHKFKGITSVHCIEIYQVLLIDPDIKRRTGGGLE